MSEIGDLCEIQGELTVEWKIKNFSTVSQEKKKHYTSPKFYFSGTSWKLIILPNGDREDKHDGWIGLFIMKKATGSRITLTVTFAIKKTNGSKDCEITSEEIFDEKNFCLGYDTLVLRSTLFEKKNEFIPSDELSIICILQNTRPNPVTGSLFHRLQDISDNLKEIAVKNKRTDFTLKFNDQEICAHRMILETRSPVFAAMLNHDTKENETGEVFIDDIDAITMKGLVNYMYCGDIDKLTTDNVLLLYAAAHKYDIKDVRQICCEFIIRNLSVQWLCEVIKFADLYQDEEISSCAREYFKNNASEILETEEWKNLVKENNNIAVDLLSTVLKTVLKR